MTLINIGINDAVSAVSAASFTASVTTAIQKARSGGGDVMLIIPNGVSTASATAANQLVISDAIKALSVSADVPLIDLTSLYLDYTAANAAGVMYDTLHPTKAFYAQAAALIARVILLAA